VTLIGVGSEMVFAVEAREKLMEVGVRARIVSFPCQRLFEVQTRQYKESVMQYSRRKPIVVIEAYAVNCWERYADAGYTMKHLERVCRRRMRFTVFSILRGGK